MKLSIVVIFFNMRREARRTLYSLSPAYQQGVSEDDYEVIAIDNASSEPLDPDEVSRFGANFRYLFFETDSVSPVEAMNYGAAQARGKSLSIIVDGARMASPGLVRQSLAARQAVPGSFVCALSWHLGPDIQPKTTQDGYNQQVEDALLEEAKWRENGYRLFDISTIAPSSHCGVLGGFPNECSWFCIGRGVFHAIGGYSTAFTSPGGGFCNHEFRDRVLQTEGITPIVLLGEGVFHQVHGGTMTSAPLDNRPIVSFRKEYRQKFGTEMRSLVCSDPLYFGSMPPQARRFLA